MAAAVNSKQTAVWRGRHALIRWRTEKGQSVPIEGETILPGRQFHPTLSEAKDFRDLIHITVGSEGIPITLADLAKMIAHPSDPDPQNPKLRVLDLSEIDTWFRTGDVHARHIPQEYADAREDNGGEC